MGVLYLYAMFVEGTVFMRARKRDPAGMVSHSLTEIDTMQWILLSLVLAVSLTTHRLLTQYGLSAPACLDSDISTLSLSTTQTAKPARN